jgi:hypothetical protein
MNQEFSKMMKELYKTEESPLVWDSLCDEVKDAILKERERSAKNDPSNPKFEEDITDIIIGDKKDEE